MEKLIQANENELKLTRIDAEEKQRMVEELRTQLQEINARIGDINTAQESSKGTVLLLSIVSICILFFLLPLDEFESQLSTLTRDYAESKKEIVTLTEELRKYKDTAFELETERDRYAHESERHAKAAEEREKAVEKAVAEMATVKEQFADYKKRAEVELESTKQNVTALDGLSVELERSRGLTRQIESENGQLREGNRALAAKVEELQEDIEGKSSAPVAIILSLGLFACFISLAIICRFCNLFRSIYLFVHMFFYKSTLCTLTLCFLLTDSFYVWRDLITFRFWWSSVVAFVVVVVASAPVFPESSSSMACLG